MNRTHPTPSLLHAAHSPRVREPEARRLGLLDDADAGKPLLQKSARRDAVRRSEADAEIRELMRQRPR